MKQETKFEIGDLVEVTWKEALGAIGIIIEVLDPDTKVVTYKFKVTRGSMFYNNGYIGHLGPANLRLIPISFEENVTKELNKLFKIEL